MKIHARKLPFARVGLLGACLTVSLVTAGCEDEVASGDRQIRESIQRSYAEANTADATPAKIIPTLSEAAAVRPASPLYQAQAQALLGQASYAAAMESIPALNTLDVRIGQLLRQISRLSTRVLENTFSIEAMKGTNPAQQKTTFQKSGETFAQRLAELDRQIAEAQKNLGAKSAQIKDLEARRQAAANSSTELTLKSEQVKGKESLDLYNQALEARQQASMLMHQIELGNMDLARLEQVVAGLTAQRQAAADGAETAQKQVARLDEGWTETDKLIRRQEEASKKIVDESGIASRSAELKKVSEEAEALRKQVNEHLTRAVDAYAAADAAAVQLDGSLSTQISEQRESPEREAWESLRKTINPFTYDIARSKALFARAHVAMSERSLLDAWRGLAQRMTPIFQQAKLDLPAELAGAELDQRIEELTKQAAEDLKTAEELLSDVIERAGEDSQDQFAARFMLMAVQYANYHLAGNANALASAKSHLQALLQSSILLPSLPSDLEQDVVNRAARAATTGPATAPGAETGAGGAEGGEGGSTWMKVLERAGAPFRGNRGGGGGAAPGGEAPAPDQPQPEPGREPAPGNETAPELENPGGREPGGNLAPPTGIDL